MAEGVTQDLVILSLFTGIVGIYIASRDLSWLVSFWVTFIKILIPFIYFALFYNGDWTFLDDLRYEEIGAALLQQGHNALSPFLNWDVWNMLTVLSGGQHFLYSWWNLLAQSLFGIHYYSAVFLNVLLTFVSGYVLVRLAKLMGFNAFYAKGLLVFYLLHWEILSWTSFLNFKDMFVQMLTILSFYYFLQLFSRIKIRHLVVLLILTFSFFWIRYYIPLLLAFSALCWVVFFQRGVRKYLALAMVAAGLISWMLYIGISESEWLISTLLNPETTLFGFFKMALTPRPWALSSECSFLFLSSYFHWLFFIPAIAGGWWLWRSSRQMALLIIYLVVMLVFYGSASELMGVRVRFQVVFIYAWLQYHCLWVLVQAARKRGAFKFSLAYSK